MSDRATKVGLVDELENPINDLNPIPVAGFNSLVTEPFNSATVNSKNANGDPTQITYKFGATTVAVLTITYDGDGDLQSITKV